MDRSSGCFVLVGGWPASGKTTLARRLAAELGTSFLSKDEVKEALMDALGAPAGVEQSRRLGVAAVHAVLRAAQGCDGAVIDSTWYPYATPLARALPGPIVEIRCRVDPDLARKRFAARVRDERHLDDCRTEAELWGSEVAPLGLGPLLDVDTTGPVDVPALADEVRRLVHVHSPAG